MAVSGAAASLRRALTLLLIACIAGGALMAGLQPLGALVAVQLGYASVAGVASVASVAVAGAQETQDTLSGPDGPGGPALSGGSVAPAPVAFSALELALFERANADRLAYGLAPLAPDADVLLVARARAAAQAPAAGLTHFTGDGTKAFVELLAEAGVEYLLAGENLARLAGPDDTAAERAHLALMKSPAHRMNVLEPSFDRLAVGATVDSRGQTVFAQIFRATGQPA